MKVSLSASALFLAAIAAALLLTNCAALEGLSVSLGRDGVTIQPPGQVVYLPHPSSK